jgi:hypothetical protein
MDSKFEVRCTFVDQGQFPTKPVKLPQSNSILRGLLRNGGAYRQGQEQLQQEGEIPPPDTKMANVILGMKGHGAGNKKLKDFDTFPDAEFVPAKCDMNQGTIMLQPSRISVAFQEWITMDNLIRVIIRAASQSDLCVNAAWGHLDAMTKCKTEKEGIAHCDAARTLSKKAAVTNMRCALWTTRLLVNFTIIRRKAYLMSVSGLNNDTLAALYTIPFHFLKTLFGEELEKIAPDLLAKNQKSEVTAKVISSRGKSLPQNSSYQKKRNFYRELSQPPKRRNQGSYNNGKNYFKGKSRSDNYSFRSTKGNFKGGGQGNRQDRGRNKGKGGRQQYRDRSREPRDYSRGDQQDRGKRRPQD